MSRGLGATQRAILQVLGSATWRPEERRVLSDLLPQYSRQALSRALRRLEDEGLVTVRRYQCRAGGRKAFCEISLRAGDDGPLAA